MKLTITTDPMDEDFRGSLYVDGYEAPRPDGVEQYYEEDLNKMDYYGTWTFHVFVSKVGGREILIPSDQLKVENECN